MVSPLERLPPGKARREVCMTRMDGDLACERRVSKARTQIG
jgi:hypothetical protein